MGIGNFGSRNRSRQSRVAAANCDIKGAASHREPDGPEGAGCSPSRFNAEGSPSSKVRTAALCGSIIEIRPVLGTPVPCSATRRLSFWEKMTLVGARKPEAKTGAGHWALPVATAAKSIRAKQRRKRVRVFMDGVVVRELLIFSTGKLFHRTNLTFEAKARPIAIELGTTDCKTA